MITGREPRQGRTMWLLPALLLLIVPAYSTMPPMLLTTDRTEPVTTDTIEPVTTDTPASLASSSPTTQSVNSSQPLALTSPLSSSRTLASMAGAEGGKEMAFPFHAGSSEAPVVSAVWILPMPPFLVTLERLCQRELTITWSRIPANNGFQNSRPTSKYKTRIKPKSLRVCLPGHRPPPHHGLGVQMSAESTFCCVSTSWRKNPLNVHD
ncbi:uncharacterized protein LOC131417716 isoform X2 [Diceros bicornis minor]|uniref:uncharacterized protein LOC131417716 isoform X2 n=1 Tax=Diceros bicornis minor TaxID=77932 RepID=UPI0026E9797C|nr:uncharacterized protein LOC131417716 isoform X2 [Diceros bicornis minor]